MKLKREKDFADKNTRTMSTHSVLQGSWHIVELNKY